MAMKRVFLSFVGEDRQKGDGLRSLAASPDYDIECYDESVRSAFDSRDAAYIKRKQLRLWRSTKAAAVLLSLATGLLLAGCTKQEFVDKGTDALWWTLYIVVGIVSLFLIIGAFGVNKALGIVATIVIVAALVTWYCLSGYTEPPKDQPHATVTFLADSGQSGFKVRIDNSDIRFWHNAKRLGSGDDGEYAVRVAPGNHDIRVGYSNTVGAYTEEISKDLHYPIQVKAMETRYVLLSSGGGLLGGTVSIAEIDEAKYNSVKAYLKLPADQRKEVDAKALIDRLKLPPIHLESPDLKLPPIHLESPDLKLPPIQLPAGDDIKTMRHAVAERLVEDRAKGKTLTSAQKQRLVNGVEQILESNEPAEQWAREIDELWRVVTDEK